MLAKLLTHFLVYAFLFGFIAQVSAQGTLNPTPQQIEQLKRLSPQQQRALAQKMGVDLNSHNSAVQKSDSDTATQGSSTTVYPRGTSFDEMGNPIDYVDPIDRYLEIERQEIKPFGYDLFSGAPSTFAPTMDTPVPASYILGPGDTVDVQLYGKENYNYRIEIDRDGFLAIPSLKPFKIAGLTFSEAKRFVSEFISQNKLGVESHLSMGELRTMRIFVLGEAFKPGAYTVSSLTTITQALFVSGGVNDIASLRNIQLKRAGKVIKTLDLYDLLNHGDTSNDELMQPGDVVFIPVLKDTITVAGEVRRPAIYELKGDTSFSSAIEMAGGFVSEAYSSLLNVKRVLDGSLTQITIDDIRRNEFVSNGDFIEVSGVSDTVDRAITIVGAVARPGSFQWFEGRTIRDYISDRNKDLLNETDLSYALLLRNYKTGEDLRIYQFSPSKLLARVAGHDFKLNKEDILVFFSQVETRELGSQTIEEMALTKSELDELEKENWKKRIEQRLFWQQIGFGESEGIQQGNQLRQQTGSSPIINLSDDEKRNISQFIGATEFSRKRLLSPIIEQLRVHASFENPLKIVEISGSVRHPGLYPVPENGNLRDIFIAAGGLSESAFSHLSELTRYSNNSEGEFSVNNITFAPSEIMNGQQEILLQSRDRISIYRNPEWQEKLQVELAGEVAFPGFYTIRRGETLSNVLERAGGLTSYADPNASIFLRQSLREQENQNLRKLTEDLRKEIASEGLRSKSGNGALVSYSEVQMLLEDLTSVQAQGRLVIDLNEVLTGRAESDLPLENNDRLIIPGINKTVNVIGEVFVPTSHLYTEGHSLEDYISLSGGYKELAEEDSIYIVKANGSVVVPDAGNSYWYQSSSRSVSLSPGDTIVVPYDSSHVDNLTLWTSATQIVYRLAVTVAAIGSL